MLRGLTLPRCWRRWGAELRLRAFFVWWVGAFWASLRVCRDVAKRRCRLRPQAAVLPNSKAVFRLVRQGGEARCIRLIGAPATFVHKSQKTVSELSCGAIKFRQGSRRRWPKHSQVSKGPRQLCFSGGIAMKPRTVGCGDDRAAKW